jgi:hypothetical protein
MKNTIKTILFGATIAAAVSCSKESAISVPANKPVVEAYLIPGQVADIVITKEIPFDDSTQVQQTIDNLTVTINNEGKDYPMKSIGGGHYVSDIKILENKTYSLKFVSGEGKTVTSNTIVPARTKNFKADLTEITATPGGPGGHGSGPGGNTTGSFVALNWTNEPNGYYMIVVESIDPNAEAINSNNNPNGGKGSPRRFRNRPDIMNTFELQSRQFQYYGLTNIILFHINPEYVALYNAPTNNSQNLQPPPSNVTNGLGIFTGVAADTIQILVKKP